MDSTSGRSSRADQGARQTISILSDLNAGQTPLLPLTRKWPGYGLWIAAGVLLAAVAGGSRLLLDAAPPPTAPTLRPLPAQSVPQEAAQSAVIRESPVPAAVLPQALPGVAIQNARTSRPAASPKGPPAPSRPPAAAETSERDVEIVTAIVK